MTVLWGGSCRQRGQSPRDLQVVGLLVEVEESLAWGECLNWVLEKPGLQIFVLIQSRQPDWNPWCMKQACLYTDHETWIPNQTFSRSPGLGSDVWPSAAAWSQFACFLFILRSSRKCRCRGQGCYYLRPHFPWPLDVPGDQEDKLHLLWGLDSYSVWGKKQSLTSLEFCIFMPGPIPEG